MNNHRSVFLTEVFQQPDALRELISYYRAEGAALLEQWRTLARNAGRVLFSGMGTSEIAPELILAKLADANIDASTVDAGELLHYPRYTEGLTVLISQSGESAEIVKLVERIDRTERLIGITNNTDGALARSVSVVLPIVAGAESAISTKTYVNTLAVLFLLAETLNDRPDLDRLEKVADSMSEYDREAIVHAADLLADAKAIHFIARGPAMVAARQAALTFMEGTRTSASAFTGGAFRHGPFELVDQTHRCVFFVPGGRTFPLLEKMVAHLAAKASHVVVVTDQDLKPPGPSCCVLRVPDCGEDLFALCAATTQELLLDAVARARGVRAGEFRYIGKITDCE